MIRKLRRRHRWTVLVLTVVLPLLLALILWFRDPLPRPHDTAANPVPDPAAPRVEP